MSLCFSRLTISSMISPSPLTNLEGSRETKQVSGQTPSMKVWRDGLQVHARGAQPYLVRPVSGSTTLRITLCLASYSSLVRGLLVASRAFCSSVMTAVEDQSLKTTHESFALVEETDVLKKPGMYKVSHQVQAPPSPHHSATPPGKPGVSLPEWWSAVPPSSSSPFPSPSSLSSPSSPSSSVSSASPFSSSASFSWIYFSSSLTSRHWTRTKMTRRMRRTKRRRRFFFASFFQFSHLRDEQRVVTV